MNKFLSVISAAGAVVAVGWGGAIITQALGLVQVRAVDKANRQYGPVKCMVRDGDNGRAQEGGITTLSACDVIARRTLDLPVVWLRATDPDAQKSPVCAISSNMPDLCAMGSTGSGKNFPYNIVLK